VVLIGVAVGICLIGTAFLGLALAQGRLQAVAAVLGFGLLFGVLVAPLGGLGILSLVRGRAERAEEREAEALRTVLDMVKTRGRVNVSDLVIQLKSDQPSVQSMIYRLVGMGVFDGYVNWDEGVLYSEEASALHEVTQCKHCGGNLTLAGKGIVKCPFCGTEYFLSR
jgi:hypothetical protein